MQNDQHLATRLQIEEANTSCIPRVLRCTEVSRPNDVKGQTRQNEAINFKSVLTSSTASVADIKLTARVVENR
jgi:hypothetical protein